MKFLKYKWSMIVLLAAVLIVCALEPAARSALVDWAKHEEWRRKQMEELLQEIKLKGSAPYVIMSFKNYDTNNDGRIDAAESKPIEEFLKQKPTAKK